MAYFQILSNVQNVFFDDIQCAFTPLVGDYIEHSNTATYITLLLYQLTNSYI